MAVPWKWAAKAAVQKTMSVLPDSDRLNHLVQRLTGRDELLDDQIDTRLEMAAMHLDAMVRAGVADVAAGLPAGSRIAELGTGWHPAIPVLLYLLGADDIVTIDHVDHTSHELLVATIHGLAGAVDDGRVAAALPPVHPERCARLVELAAAAAPRSGDELLDELGIRSIVADVRQVVRLDAAESDQDEPTPGGDRRDSGSPSDHGAPRRVAPMDAVVSNLVLEHIPREILGEVIRSCYDLLRSGGVMSHVIDLCDHGSYVDPSLSQYNFLRFSERAWRLVDNDIQHENRLRESEVEAIYASVDIPIDWSANRRGDWPDLARVPLAEPFRYMDRDDLLVLMTHPVSLHP